jgi:carbon storage regulator
MLVLSRKLNEKIVIDDQIQITVLGIDNGKVQLGIEAPKNIEILR